MALKRTAVVTGAAGFLGSHLTDRLLKEGFRVIGIDNFITGSAANIEHLAGNEDYKFIKHDVSNYIFLPDEVHNVFHFASPASPVDYLEHPIPTLKVGAHGTHNTLGLAKAKKRDLPARLHQRVLWRSAGASAAGDLLGQCEPHRPARRV